MVLPNLDFFGITPNLKQEIQQKDIGTTKPAAHPRKRKINNSQAEFLNICTATLKANSKEINEFDATGINVAKKLVNMEPLQAIYAELLINSILLKGLLNKLMEETNFCDNGCKFRRTETAISSLQSLSLYSTVSQTQFNNTRK